MAKELTVDLTCTNAIHYNSEQLFQANGYQKIKGLFQDTLNWLKQLKKDALGDIAKCRSHNTILIFGERGCGKTIFLSNIEEQLKNSAFDSSDSFEFLNLIDPTLLCSSKEIHSSEAFISVIVALINSHVQKEVEIQEDKARKLYYHKLREVAEALQAMKSRNGEFGIDEIYSNQTTLKLEQSLHDYFKQVTIILEKSILILRIDDIDMAFTHGFQILETVRKYLASPYILPVISGDKSLYNTLIQKNFSQDMNSRVFPRQPSTEASEKEFERHVSHLSEKYIIKVMPFDRQLRLQPLAEILQDNEINFKLAPQNVLLLSEIQSLEADFFNHGIKRPEYQNKTLLEGMDSMRTWMQYRQKMSHWYQKAIATATHLEKWFGLYQEFQQNHYDFFINAEQYQELAFWADCNIKSSQSGVFNHGKLLNLLDSENRRSRRFEFLKSEQSGSRSDAPVNLIPLENTGDSTPGKKLAFPIARIDRDSKSDRAIKKLNEEDAKVRFIFKLFIFNNYYTRSSRVDWLIFAGRFIEFTFSTISAKYQKEQYDWEEAFRDNWSILEKMPLFTEFDTHKHFIDLPNQAEEETALNPDEFVVGSEKISEIIADAGDQPVTSKDFFDAHFLREVLNRFYSNLNVFRSSKLDSSESLLSYAQRCAYMLLNAVGACETAAKEKVSFRNIALMPIFSQETLQDKDYCFTRNIKPHLEPENRSLTQLLFHHPVIQLLLNAKANVYLNASLINSGSISKQTLRQKIAKINAPAELITLLEGESEDSVNELCHGSLPKHAWGKVMQRLFNLAYPDEKEKLCQITGKDAAYFA